MKLLLEYLKNRLIKHLVTIYLIIVFLLLIFELVKYPGITQAYLHIDIHYLLFFAVVLFFTLHKKVSKKNETLTLLVTLLSTTAFIYFNIQEQIHFPNYVYSIYHISTISARNIAIYLTAFLLSSIVNYENFQKSVKNLFSPAKNKNRWLIYLLFSIFFSLFIYKDNFKAQWSMIDDHETAYFLGSDKKIEPLEIPNILSKTEIGHFGQSTRYRPSYYFLRVIETTLWGNRPQLWYVFRYFILVSFVFGSLYIISNYFGTGGALIFTLYVMTAKYWTDIWTRLGPAEIYVVLGITLISVGIYKLSKSKTPLKIHVPWIMYFIGCMLATGSKENMVILILPSLYLLISQLKNRKFNWRGILLAIHIIYCLVISIEIFISIGGSGQNVYADPISVLKILEILRLSFTNRYSIPIFIFAILALVFLLYAFKICHQTQEIKDFLKNKKITITVAGYFLLVYFSQFIFYLGKWPTNVRYDYPGILALQIFWLTVLYLILAFIGQTTKLTFTTKNILILVFNICFFGYLTILTISTGFKPLTDSVRANRTQTNAFTNEMLKLSETAKKNSEAAIIFKSNGPWDYEQIFSLERYLRFENVSNEVFLDYIDENLNKESGLYKQLSKELTNISSLGADKNHEISFKPFKNSSYANNCILISFSGAINEKCNSRFNF